LAVITMTGLDRFAALSSDPILSISLPATMILQLSNDWSSFPSAFLRRVFAYFVNTGLVPTAAESLFHIRGFSGPFAAEFGMDAGGRRSPLAGTICIIALCSRAMASVCAASSSGAIVFFHYFAGGHLCLSDQGTFPLAAQFGDDIVGFGLIDASTSMFS